MTTIYDAGGNYTKLIEQQHDEDNNLLSCPKCNSTHLIKRGKDTKTQGQPQRYQCRDCGHKTVHPKKCMNFEVENPFTEEEKQLIKDVLIYMMDYINDDCFTEEDREHYDSVYIKLS